MTERSLLYRPEIDGLRAVAVLPVLFFHAGFVWAPGGYIGVDVFFVISGYLITTILLKEAESGHISLLRFYERRARRILPALFLVLLVSITLAYLTMLPSQMEDFARSVLAVLLFVSNIFFWREDDYFGAEAEEMPLLHTWSLAVEEQFYLFFPLLLIAILFVARRHVLAALILMTVGSLAVAIWAQAHPTISDAAVFYLLPARAWELGIGAICGYVLLHHPLTGRDILSGTGLSMVLASVILFDKSTPTPSLYTMLPVVGAALVILFCRAGGITHWALASAPMIWIGLLSYSLYLWHQPLFAFARIAVYGQPEPWQFWALILLATGMAWVTLHFVETPVRKAAITPGRVVFPALSAAFAVLAVSAATEWRFDLKERLIFADARYDKVQWPERDPNVDVCMTHRVRPVPIDEVCQYGWGKKFVAVVGNSHAEGYASSLGDHLLGSGLAVREYTASACPFVHGLSAKDDIRSLHCLTWTREVTEEILGRSDISHIVIAFRIESKPWNQYTAIRNFISAALNADKTVIFVNQPPMQPETVEHYVYRRLDASGNALGRPLAEWHNIYQETRQAVMALPEKSVVIELDDIFCNAAGQCYPVRDGIALYRDEDHISLHAVNLVTQRIAKVILQEQLN